MKSSQAFLVIRNKIESPEDTFPESPLLKDVNIEFNIIINLDNFLKNYNCLLTLNEALAFNNINFTEVQEDELNQIKNQYVSKNENQKKLIILFMLLIVLKQNKYYDIFDINGIKYGLLFNSLLLPYNPKNKCSKDLIIYINNFLIIEFFKKSSESSQVIQAINSYISESQDDNSIYNFLPFFIKLLDVSDQDLIKKFIESELFKKVISISKKELPIFDFYRHFIYKYTEISFDNIIVTESMNANFFDESKNLSIITILGKAIEVHSKNKQILSEILKIFTHIISIAPTNDAKKSELVLGMISIIDNFFAIIPPDIDLSPFFMAVATYAVNDQNENSFELFIGTIRKLINQRPSFLIQLRKNNIFFSILSKCKKKINHSEFINFAKLTSGKMILLYQVIYVLLSLIPNIPESEGDILSELFELSKNSGNIIELDRAKVPEFILKRLPIIQDNNGIREKYLELFSVITSEIYHKTTFIKTVELLKNPNFKYSCSVLSIMKDYFSHFLLDKEHNYSAFNYRKEQLLSHNTPFSFFRFDNQTGSGLISPTLHINTTFSFSFWIRINEIDLGTEKKPDSSDPDTYIDPNEIPLVFFDSETHKLDMFLSKREVKSEKLNSEQCRIFVRYSENKQNVQKELLAPTPFDYVFEQGKWYFINISFQKNKFKLNVFDENNNQSTNEISSSFRSIEYKVYVCRKPVPNIPEVDQPSLICDMSAFLLQNESKNPADVKKLLIDYLSSFDFNINRFSNLLCLFDPAQSQDNLCFNVNRNILQVPYSGRTIPIIPNFLDVIHNESAINVLLPLINCLSSEKKGDKGSKNLNLILSIFSNIINFCENSLLRVRFFETLVSFLYHCENLIDQEVFKVLFDMFPKIKNHELQKSILTSIYLNYDFISRLDGPVSQLFITYSPLQLYKSKEFNPKIVFDDLSSIIFTGYKHFYQNVPNSSCYWEYVKKLCIDSPNDTNIMFLEDIVVSNKSEFFAERVLDILDTIFTSKTDLSKYTNFTPFTIVYSQYHDSMRILKLVINIIKTILQKADVENKYTPVFHIMNVFKPSQEKLQLSLESLIKIALNLVLEEGMISFFPFLVTLLQNSNNNDLNKEFYENFADSKSPVKKEFPQMPYWHYWITKFFIQAFDPNPNKSPREFVDLIIRTFKTFSLDSELRSSLMIELLNFFQLYNALISNPTPGDYKKCEIDFTSVIEILIIYIIENEKYVKYSYIYDLLLFSVKPVRTREVSYLTFIGDFVLELLSEYNLIVSLRKTVNQELLKKLKNKTQTRLIRTYVQFAGGKIDVKTNDANSYLAKMPTNANGNSNEHTNSNTNSNSNSDANSNENSNSNENANSNANSNSNANRNSNANGNEDAQNNKNEQKVVKYNTISTEVLTECLKDYEDYFKDRFKNILNWNQDIVFDIGVKKEWHDDVPVEQKLVYICDDQNLVIYTKYYTKYPEFLNEQETKCKNESSFLYKLKDSFIKSISKIPGPWENPNKNKEVKHFKILNRVSKTGKKMLMRINDAFNDHLDASQNRKELGEKNFVEKPIYKINKEILNISDDSFTTEVLIFSQSRKNMKGLLIATEKFITLKTESSNVFIYWEEIEFIMNRKTINIDNSCEIFKNNGRGYYISFPENQRKLFYSYIDKLNLKIDALNNGIKFDFFKSLRNVCGKIYQTKDVKVIMNELKLCSLWVERKITTFAYIYYLNILSGRSYNYINKYIIFPFILSDLSKDFLLPDDEGSYRDFSMPSAGLSPSILQDLIVKFNENKEDMNYIFCESPLNEARVVNYLIRAEPYTTIHVSDIQGSNGFPKFDDPSRLFNSIDENLKKVYANGLGSELTPEFFCLPFFMTNENEFDLGVLNKEKVNNVKLPEWSGNYYSFTSALRMMLEGKFSDEHICKWIDLLFGVKRLKLEYQGQEYPLYRENLYPDLYDPSKSTNEVLEIEQIVNFGTVPEQLFTEPHPKRNEPPEICEINLEIADDRISKIQKYHGYFVKEIIFFPNSSIAYKLQIPSKENNFREFEQITLGNICGVPLCFSRCLNLLIFGTKADPFLTAFNVKSKETRIICPIPFIITTVFLASGRFLIIGTKDCSIRVYDLLNDAQISSSGFHTETITSIGCCYENGLLVSADTSSTLIFETLTDHVFINSVSLNEIKKKLIQIGTKTHQNNNNDNHNNSNNNNNNDDNNNNNSNNNNNFNENDNNNNNSNNNNDNFSENNNNNNNNSNDNNNNFNENNNNSNDNDDGTENFAAFGSDASSGADDFSNLEDDVFDGVLFDAELKNMFSSCSSRRSIIDDVREYCARLPKAPPRGCANIFDPDPRDVPQICVFKSGTVAVGQRSSVFLFDSRGKLLSIKSFDAEVVAMKKCYDNRQREFLIVGVEPRSIHVFNVGLLALAIVYDSYFGSITTMQKGNTFVTYYKGTVQTFDFWNNVYPLMVSKKPDQPTYA